MRKCIALWWVKARLVLTVSHCVPHKPFKSVLAQDPNQFTSWNYPALSTGHYQCHKDKEPQEQKCLHLCRISQYEQLLPAPAFILVPEVCLMRTALWRGSLTSFPPAAIQNQKYKVCFDITVFPHDCTNTIYTVVLSQDYTREYIIIQVKQWYGIPSLSSHSLPCKSYFLVT